MTAPIQIVHIVRQGIAGPPGPAGPGGAGGVFTEIATQAEAEAGADNGKGMTPLRVQQKVTFDLNAAVVGLVASAPATLDTLNELAAALGNDANFATTTATALGNRLRVDAAQGLTAPQKTQGQSNIGLVIGTDVQGFNANLASLAGLTLAADKLPYATAANTLALADLTAAGRSMIAAADAAAQKTLLAITKADVGGLADTDTPTFDGVNIPNNSGVYNGNNLLLGGSQALPSALINTSGDFHVKRGIVLHDGSVPTSVNQTWLRYDDVSGSARLSSSFSDGGVGDGVLELGNIVLTAAPTADPHVAGKLWSNAGALTVSAG